MIDCLIIGFNDSDFGTYVDLLTSMGTDSGAFRDLNLAFIEHEGKPYRSMDILNRFYWEDKPGEHKPFHNADFLWPVVTYLGSYLSKRNLTFDYVNLFHLEKEKLREKLMNNEVLTVAITTTLYVSPHPILDIVPFVREHNDKAKILIGGPYISNQPKLADQQTTQRLFDYLGADIYVISQEGEAALVNTIKALKNGTSLDKVDNIAYRDGHKFVMTATSIESNPLEENRVDYSLFPRHEMDEFVTLRTAKSCPFSCSFCGFPQRAGKYKYLGVELVEQELNAIREIGNVTTLTFIDDTFNVPKERFREMLRMMINNNYGFKWNSFYRSDHGDEATIELMAAAGCEGVFLGVEAGSNEMLQKMNKTARREHYMKSIPLLREAGVSTHANLIVGFPGDTYETYLESISLIEEAKPDFYRAQLWYADPVTPIWNKVDEYGVKGSSFNWSHNTMDYKTACDLVDRMFISIEGSIWLPQNGFEQWSTFYLQRKGMKMEQIKAFLKCFNAIIKQKLVEPERTEINPTLLESLKQSAKFDSAASPSMEPIEVYSGSNYLEAERFWLGEFSGGSGSPDTSDEANPVFETEAARRNMPCVIEKAVFDSVRARFGDELHLVILAAYAILHSLMSEREQADIIFGFARTDFEASTVPLRLRVSPDVSFSRLLQTIREKLARSASHSAFSPYHFIANPRLMGLHGNSCPVFKAGYMFSDTTGGGRTTKLDEALEAYPQVRQQLGILLEVVRNDGDISLSLSYTKDGYDHGAVEVLAADMNGMLREAAENPDVPLAELGLSTSAIQGATVQADATEVFNF